MIRKIIKIDEALCDGCELCIPNCAEGAIQIIEGKVRLISDLFCDGLGACLGHCPQGAITIEEREAEAYNEKVVMEYIVKGGAGVIKAHLDHLKEHGENKYLSEAIEYLNENRIDVPVDHENKSKKEEHSGCPGSRSINIKTNTKLPPEETGGSYLENWPIQLHLASPRANYFYQSDLLIAADCVAFSYPNFQSHYLKDKKLLIACPKLDSNQEIYSEKLTEIFSNSEIRSVTIVIMQVPCCGGLFRLVESTIKNSGKQIPIKLAIVGISGEILKETEVSIA